MIVQVVPPESEDTVTEFVLFRDEVYRAERIRMPGALSHALSFLRGETPFTEGRALRLLMVCDASRILARVVAVDDQRYNRHQGERRGHLIMFEARRDTRDACRLLFDSACDWLRNRGAIGARVGFGPFEPGLLVDHYEQVLLRMMRHSFPYYHSLLKGARFETEKGAGEYTINVDEELRGCYEQFLRRARRSAYDIRFVRDVAAARRVPDFTRAWNEGYDAHWGLAPITEREFAVLFDQTGTVGALEFSTIAYRGTRPVGVALVLGHGSMGRTRSSWFRKAAHDEVERLCSFAVGVSPFERGRGLALALASLAYLELIARGATQLSYGLVLDDNWPSRRTAEKLGARVSSNYLTYQRAI